MDSDNIEQQKAPTYQVTATVAQSPNLEHHKKKRKTRIIIMVAIILAILSGVAFAALWLLPQLNNKASTDNSTAESSVSEPKPDLSQDYGACNLVTLETVQKNLSGVSSTITGPFNAGLAGSAISSSQVCVYSFDSSATYAEGVFNRINSFSIETYEIDTLETKNGILQFIPAEDRIESTLGDTVIFTSLISNENNKDYTQYVLQVYKGLKFYSFQISRPSSDISIDVDTARDSLVGIAESAKY